MKFEDFYSGIKKAIDFEEKYQYIDFIGKTTCFSDFIIKSLNDFKKKLNKIDKGRVDTVISCFYQYRFDSISGRMSSIKMLNELLEYFKPIGIEYIPESSILREFIGGSIFSY